MKYPKHLPEGGTIGFAAPSFGCNIEPYLTLFKHAQKKFSHMGYQLDLGPNCYEGKGIGISNTPEKCGEELTEYYCSKKNDILISCGGGELMCETMDHVDFDRVKQAEPKWYMGYSDNTNMTFLLATICDTASIYGPHAAEFGMEPWHASLQDVFDILTGTNTTVSNYDLWEKESIEDEEQPLLPYNLTEPFQIRKVPEGAIQMEGRLLGGCMDCLRNLLGTNFDHVKEFNERYKEDGIIWFLEACDFNVLDIRRALWQMEHAGWFQYVKGFIFGRPRCYGQELLGMDQYLAVTGILEKYNVPIIMDVDLGHMSPMMPIVCGSYGIVKSEENDIQIEMLFR